jgi:hypothetical protein
MTHIDLDSCTSTISLADLANAIDAAKEIIPIFDNDTPWWRGHANKDWPLQPQVFREDPDNPGHLQYKDGAALIGHFVTRAPTRSHRACPAADDYFGWLFLAQHYGLPTCLLDWSENPLVALFFAVTHLSEEEDGCLWAMCPSGLNRAFYAANGLVRINDSAAIELAKDVFISGRKPHDLVIAIDGQEIDPRMLVQMSRFTFHGDIVQIEAVPESHKWLRRYVIPKDQKEKIRRQLAAMGIRQANIFPDLANLAAELKASPW